MRPIPTVVSHWPARVAWSSTTILLLSAKISPQVNSAVGYPRVGEPETTTPRRRAAATSMDALPIPGVNRCSSLGNRFSRDSGKGVRSRITQTISNSRSRSASRSSSSR